MTFLHKSNEDNCRYELNSWHYLPKHHESKTKWCKIPFSFTFPREILNAVDRPMLKQRKFLTLKGYGKKFLLKFFVKFLYFTEVIYYPLIYSPFHKVCGFLLTTLSYPKLHCIWNVILTSFPFRE